MTKWQGRFEQLQATVRELGLTGEWFDITNGKQFKCSDAAILNWFPSSGTLQLQGKPSARDALRDALNARLSETQSYVPSGSQEQMLPESSVEEKVFVVHGHDQTPREQLELVLHKLGRR